MEVDDLAIARAGLGSVVRALQGQGVKVTADVTVNVSLHHVTLLFRHDNGRGFMTTPYFMGEVNPLCSPRDWSNKMVKALKGALRAAEPTAGRVGPLMLFTADLHGMNADDVRAIAVARRAMDHPS